MHRRFSGSMVESGKSDQLSIVIGILGGVGILLSAAADLPAVWWTGFGFSLFILTQLQATRDSRGHAGKPKLQRVISSIEQWSIQGRRHS